MSRSSTLRTIFVALAVSTLFGPTARAASPGIISTVAGGVGDGGSASMARLHDPLGVAADTSGNLFIADADLYSGYHAIRKVDPAGTVTMVAGGVSPSGDGDGGFATNASLLALNAIAIDSFGDLLIAEHHRIRKVNASGIISTVAGTGTPGFSGDGGPATSARLNHPIGIAVDTSGNLLIVDAGNSRVRKVSPTGTITTVAGNGTRGFSGDGGPATSASFDLYSPSYWSCTCGYGAGIAVDPAGNLFIADTGNWRIRKVSPAGTITTVAEVYALGIALNSTGDIFIAGDTRIQRLSGSGIITTVAGTGTPGFSGDGGPATGARFNGARAVAVHPTGDLFIADMENRRIRKVGTTGTITTVTGNGLALFSGDGGPATSALLSDPADVALDSSGNLFIADAGNSRIRKVDASGTITTVTTLFRPGGIAVDPSGNLFVADTVNSRIRKIDPSGTITTVAGGGGPVVSTPDVCVPVVDYDPLCVGGVGIWPLGDGGSATEANLLWPSDVAVSASGELFIADTGNNRIRKVDTSGRITTLAGGGPLDGRAADGFPGIAASLRSPRSVTMENTFGNVYFTDGANLVRRVDPTGGIFTIAGTGSTGFSGDGGRARDARLNQPTGLAVASSNLYIADAANERIRRVNLWTGIITTVAGNGWLGFAGDGGPATSARFMFFSCSQTYNHVCQYTPAGIAVDPVGNLVIADSGNHRIRKVTA